MPHETYATKQYAISAQALEKEYTWRSLVHSHHCNHCAKSDVWYVPDILILLPEEIAQLIPTLIEEADADLNIWQRRLGNNGPAFLLIRNVVEQGRQTRYVATKWGNDASESIKNTIDRCTAREHAPKEASKGILFFCGTLMFVFAASVGVWRVLLNPAGLAEPDATFIRSIILFFGIGGCVFGLCSLRSFWRALRSHRKVKSLSRLIPA